MNICHYGCGQEGKVQFDNGFWCCSETFHRCPAERERRRQRMLAKYHNSKRQVMQREIEAGIHRCGYCGKPAKYWAETAEKFCCKRYARDCPGYSEYLSKKHKLKYKENPELIEHMSEKMKEVQNRADVRQAKRLRMIHLHNDNCEECLDFQKKFKKGHKDRRGPNYERNMRYLKGVNNGPDNSST